MGQAPYQVLDIDLGTTGSAVPITVLANAKITFVGVLSKPAGASLYLKFGSGGDAIPLTDNWTGLRFPEPHDQGVYFRNDTVQAGVVTLLIGFFQPCGG